MSNMRPLVCLDGDLKSGASVADLILTMDLKKRGRVSIRKKHPYVITSHKIGITK